MARPPQSTSTTSFADEIDDAVLQELYSWVDQIPLSRPKKNLTRDFSDGGKKELFTLYKMEAPKMLVLYTVAFTAYSFICFYLFIFGLRLN